MRRLATIEKDLEKTRAKAAAAIRAEDEALDRSALRRAYRKHQAADVKIRKLIKERHEVEDAL